MSMAGVACSVCTSCATSICCSFGMSKSGTVRGAKPGYLMFLALSCILAIVFRYWGADSINLVAWKINCSPPGSNITDSGGGHWSPSDLIPGEQTQYYASCKGNAAVYRISFMTSAFFLIMAVGSAMSKTLHVGLWMVKCLLYCVLIISGFFIPNYVFDNSGYAWVSRVCSVIFLLCQILILVDFGYTWNDDWYEKGEKEVTDGHPGCCTGCCGGWGGSGARYFGGILGSCAACYIFFITGISLLYTYYNFCAFNTAIITVTLLLVAVLTLVQLTTPAEIGGALLPAAVVSAYATYLCWSALANNPDESCFATSGIGSHNNNPGLMAVGIIITGVSLAWTTNTAANSLPGLFQHNKNLTESESERAREGGSGFYSLDNDNGGGSVNPTLNSADIEAGPSGASNNVQLTDGEGESTSAEDEKDKVDAQHVWAFHLILCVGSIYMAMLLTNWGSAIDTTEVVTNDGASVTRGKTAMWITILTQWLAVLLYIWTLTAPRLLPGREFS